MTLELDLGRRARAFRDELRSRLAHTVPDDQDERRALVAGGRGQTYSRSTD